MAFRAATDVASFAAAGFPAGVNQAADTPDYVQEAKGFGQRFGGPYEITRPARSIQPLVAKGDNSRWQFNYSSVGGDLASGALSNLYYPHSNRGAGLVFDNALITTGGRIANALAQEFILRRFTTKAKSPN